VLPNDAIFNVRVDNLPLNANSAAWSTNAAPNVGLSFDTAWGTSIGDNTMPLTDETFYYTSTENGPWLIPPPPYLKRENGDYIGRGNNEDHHILAVNRNTCQFYETYNNFLTPAPCSDPAQTCTATSGWAYNSASYLLPANGSTDAASLPLAPLTLHLDEIKAGAVRHPLRFTLARGYIQAGNALWPAFGTNGWGGNNMPPYGARFRLKASYDISRFSQAAQTVLTGLKEYGMILADIGPGPTAQADTDLTRDPIVMAGLNQIASSSLSLNNFEVVDESNLMVSPTSSQVNPANGYVTPTMYAAITATDQSNTSYQASYTVPLQGVSIGLFAPTMTIVAGMPGYQLSWWINGSSNQSVTWSLVSGPGTVTSAGVYTPPTNVSAPTSALLLATSAADPNVTENLYVTIIPTGTNPAGSIRVDSGGKGVTDGNGNVWLADVGYESGNYIQLNGDGPAWPDASNPEIAVYESGGYTYGTDLAYYFVLPNGNYKVRLMFGQPYNGASPATCSPFNQYWHAPLNLETQSQTQIHNFDFGLIANYQCATPVDEYIPATVTNNNLEIALRAAVPEGSTITPGPLLNGLEIIPDSTAPYLAIDSQQQTSVTAGNTVQLYAIGWYMNNSVTWSLSGVGTISSNGLYTAPATAPSSPQSVVITAKSTVNPSITASITLTIP
jgi:hypothetical protein